MSEGRVRGPDSSRRQPCPRPTPGTMTVRTRFAPSPTGFLHIGGVRTALFVLLAAVGLYGVLAYTVSQRTREIGLRMALGAAPGRVRSMVLRQVAWMTIVGGAVGLGGAVWLGLKAGSLLFEMKGFDPAVLALSAAALTLVALAAGFVPAHRASQVDPMLALRDQ